MGGGHYPQDNYGHQQGGGMMGGRGGLGGPGQGGMYANQQHQYLLNMSPRFIPSHTQHASHHDMSPISGAVLTAKQNSPRGTSPTAGGFGGVSPTALGVAMPVGGFGRGEYLCISTSVECQLILVSYIHTRPQLQLRREPPASLSVRGERLQRQREGRGRIRQEEW
jgi:hypothetical protein